MTLIVSNIGETTMLESIFKTASPEAFKLKLFTNDYSPVEGTVAGDLTEATGAGYAEIALTRASFTVSGDTASYAQQTFTFTGAEPTIYGYYIVETSSGKLILSERFSDAPYAIPTGGGTVKITVNVTLA